MSLSWFVVRVLAYDDYFHLLKRTEIEGVEDESSWWITRSLCVFLPYGSRQLREIGLVEFLRQMAFPRFFYLYIHVAYCLKTGTKVQKKQQKCYII